MAQAGLLGGRQHPVAALRPEHAQGGEVGAEQIAVGDERGEFAPHELMLTRLFQHAGVQAAHGGERVLNALALAAVVQVADLLRVEHGPRIAQRGALQGIDLAAQIVGLPPGQHKAESPGQRRTNQRVLQALGDQKLGARLQQGHEQQGVDAGEQGGEAVVESDEGARKGQGDKHPQRHHPQRRVGGEQGRNQDAAQKRAQHTVFDALAGDAVIRPQNHADGQQHPVVMRVIGQGAQHQLACEQGQR